MYEDLKGKKLLIVGSYNESDMVEVAHEMGLYVIVVDNVLDRKVAHAKNVADEAWDISYTDIEAVAAKQYRISVKNLHFLWFGIRILRFNSLFSN